jgi:hypothetical protein
VVRPHAAPLSPHGYKALAGVEQHAVACQWYRSRYENFGDVTYSPILPLSGPTGEFYRHTNQTSQHL